MNIYDQIDASLGMLFSENHVSVEYTSRGETRTLSAMPAGVQWNDMERVKAFGLLSSSRDFILRKCDFPEGSEPLPKDRIRHGSDLWTVYRLADEECWRSVGPSREFIRVHCKR